MKVSIDNNVPIAIIIGLMLLKHKNPKQNGLAMYVQDMAR